MLFFSLWKFLQLLNLKSLAVSKYLSISKIYIQYSTIYMYTVYIQLRTRRYVICLSVGLSSLCLHWSLSVCFFCFMSVFLVVFLSVYLSVCLLVCTSDSCLLVCLCFSICLLVYLSLFLQLWPLSLTLWCYCTTVQRKTTNGEGGGGGYGSYYKTFRHTRKSNRLVSS